MVFGGIVPSARGSLSPHQSLDLANIYLENACNANDPDIVLALCHDTEVSLSHAKRAAKHAENQTLNRGMAIAYIDLGKLLESRGHSSEAQVSYKKAIKLGGNVQDAGRPTKSSRLSYIVQSLKRTSLNAGVPQAFDPSLQSKHKQCQSIAMVPAHIFAKNLRPLAMELKLPGADERLVSTSQLAWCLSLLQNSRSSDEALEPTVQLWLKTVEKDTEEQDRLQTIATEVINAFKRDESKDTKAFAEVTQLAPVLGKTVFRDLLTEIYTWIEHAGSLDVHHLEVFVQLIKGAEPDHLCAGDLVKILELLCNRLGDTHQQSTPNMCLLALGVSRVLDAMVDTKVTDPDLKALHEPLASYLTKLKENLDPYLVYQAAYTFQALLCVPDNEVAWQTNQRRAKNVALGTTGLSSAKKSMDLDRFFGDLEGIQKGLAGTCVITDLVNTTYDDVVYLTEFGLGQGIQDSLKLNRSFERKCAWYSALRGADALIQDGELASFRKLVCEAPCRLDPAFQWGVCQRLGEIAANPMWDTDTRRGAIAFLGEIYKNDDVWGQQASVRQWILNILMQMASLSGTGLQLHATVAEALLQGLEAGGDATKQALYQACREKGPVSYPLKVAGTEIATPSLLDRAQNRPDVEGSVRLLRKRRIKERDNAVYIPPQAKANLQAADITGVPLMEKVKEFLNSDRKVLLLLGESGSGKSTFNRELEFELWQSYKTKTGRIPLHINLPSIDKPEHDMIAKQLRKSEFTEPQIREMKQHRKFILICDGYDESQQTRNLYTSNRLNQPGEWDAQMVISCRSEYLGDDYRDRFQPGDRNQKSDLSLLQEAVITPFSLDQVEAYIKQYVSVNQPLWQTDDYRQALEVIPGLKDLVKNPFLMTLSLDVLPRMADPGQNLAATRVTRLILYDQFVVQWLERGKKRLAEKGLDPQAKAVFEVLCDEGFTHRGIGYLKKLAAEIYRKQGGLPAVKYSRTKDERSWKGEFFGQDDEKQLLCEACPLTRSGNQYQFIHRSILEYGLALAVFDPQDWGEGAVPESALTRREGMNSCLSFEILNPAEGTAPIEQESDIDSPLVWKIFVNDHSLLQLLEERVQQEPVFKQQLLDFIENSKTDEKWRIAAANAITILVRAGVQFIDTDLKRIRIPGADLSYGLFDSVQLQGADLRKVNLRGAWLRQTDLSGAQMTGAQLGELPFLAENSEVRSCGYTPDEKLFTVGLSNGSISLYATSNWERTRTLVGHTGVVRYVVHAPKGRQLASCSQDNTMRLWNVETGACQRVLTGHGGWIQCVAYSPQGDRIASAGDDKTVRLWDVATGDCRCTLLGHTGGVLSVIYSPDGRQIASGSADSSVRLWNAETGSCRHVLTGHNNGVWGLSYAPHGDQVASASEDSTIRLWDVQTGDCRHILAGHSSSVLCVAFSPRGDQVASGSLDGTVRLWDVATATSRHTLTGHSDSVTSVVYLSKGDQVASGSTDKTVRLWDVSTGASCFVSDSHSMNVLSARCSPKGDQIASGSMDRTIRFWDAKTGACLRTVTGHSGTVFGIAYSPQGDQLVSGSADKSVRLWDVEAGTCRHVLTGHSKWVSSVAYSPQGRQVASASDDKTVKLWDVSTGYCRGTLHGHADGVLSVAYSPNGKQLASSSKDHTIRLWDSGTLACRDILKSHGDWVWVVAYSPQGNQLASASDDKSVRLWDVETGGCRMVLTGHSRGVTCVAYSLNGALLASGSWDKTARLWDVTSGQCRMVIRNFQEPIRSVAWSAICDANYLVTGCVDGSVLKWQVISEDDPCRVRLCWRTTNGSLVVTGASVQGVHGLTELNKQLLKQRGAICESGHLRIESSKS